MSKVYHIAVDGPAGAGKSTIARAVAERLRFVYVDTGAMYRAMALYFIKENISPEDEKAIGQAAKRVKVTITYENGVQQVILNGDNVSGSIRTPEVSAMASHISAYLPVREKLVELQKELAERESLIMDGRDIGTCVLPEADLKIYLDASPAVRAERRYKEMTEKGMECDLREIEEEIKKRDYQDMHREHSPLSQARDATYLDTSHMDIDQVIEEILYLARERGIPERD